MAYMKINTDDLILDKKIVSDNTYRYIYTMVCRADINKSNRWNMIPSTEMAVFNKAAPEWECYLQGINETQRYQLQKYPGITDLRKQMANEIASWHQMLDSMYGMSKTK